MMNCVLANVLCHCGYFSEKRNRKGLALATCKRFARIGGNSRISIAVSVRAQLVGLLLEESAIVVL
jgi:hypothetical protein